MPVNSNRAQELLNQTNEALARRFGNRLSANFETEVSQNHSHTMNNDTDITSFNDGHHHDKGKNGVTGPAVYLDGTIKDIHTHKYEAADKSDREMPQLPSSV